MSGSLRFVTATLVLAGVTSPARAEDARSVPELAVSTERVEVGMVVRDRKGAILRGLTSADLEVYEDGVRQDIESLRFVERDPIDLARLAPGAAAPAPAPDAHSGFVAIAFDRLSPGARKLAEQAVLAYVDQLSPARPIIAVFSIDHGLSTVQPFTTDLGALRQSLSRTLSTSSATFSGARERDTIRNAYAGLAEGIGQAHVASAELSGVPECRGHEEDVVRRLELMESRLLESFNSLERDQQGFATTHALLALIGGLETLPGRKAVLLFSEGLTIPAGVEATFRSVVAAANRANVSFYAADAGGLRATSTTDETRRTIDSLKGRLRQDGTAGPVTRGPSVSDQTQSGLALLEQNEDTLRLSAESGLGQLADQTGGFLIRGTNDLSAGMNEIDEELGAYYVLAYAPRNQSYDGRFRTISVRVTKAHGRLQARKGYLAMKTALPVPALDYEGPALARIENGQVPSAVPMRLRGLQFPEAPPSSLAAVVVEVPARGVTFTVDKKAGVYRQDFTIVALVRDEAHAVVAKMSQRYALSGPLDRLEAARAGQVLFYRETHLPPGSYAVEAVAYDALAGTAGSARAGLEVPTAVAGHLRASSLMVVKNAEKMDAAGPAAPTILRYGDVFLYPNLGQPLRREADGALAFFVTAWPALERPGVDVRVEVVRDGRTVATTNAAQLQPDADGRVRLASSLPLDRFAPGAYELRVTLSDGKDAETRTAAVPII